METLGDFGELYRHAFAERNLEEKRILLRRVQEQIDRWAHSIQAADSDSGAAAISLPHASVTLQDRTRRGAHERSISSAA